MMRAVLICALAFSANAIVANDDDLRLRAVEVLRDTARKSDSTLLAQISVRAGAMGLDKVRAMLSSTLSNIKKEYEAAEAKHNKCENDRSAAQDAIDDADVAVQAAAAKESHARGQKEQYEQQEKAAVERLAAITKEVAAKTQQKSEDAAARTAAVNKMDDMIGKLNGALEAMSEGSSLHALISDMKAEKESLKDGTIANSQALQRAIQAQLDDLAVEKASQTAAQQGAASNLGLVVDQVAEYSEDHNLQKQAAAQAKSNMENVLAACTVKPKTHAQKVQELADEIEGLHNALDILAPQ